MATQFLTPLGPLFGPSLMKVTVTADGREFTLHIYGDANNEMLRAAGLPRRYYYVPQRVYLAKKQTAPADFDFGMTVFKGLMTGETTLGITDAVTTDGTVETGGAFVTFSTTFALPDGVIASAVERIKASPALHAPGEPDPELGIVAIVENNVTIEVPELVHVGAGKLSFYISAQGAGRGSVEAAGISTFLVTCNQLAAGAIAGSLKSGKSPFTVHNNLKQMFYVNQCDIVVSADVSKVHDQFSAALSAGGFLDINEVSLAYAYEKTVTSGAITTKITMNNAVLDDSSDLKKMLMSQVEQMRKSIMDLVKKEIFDWTPVSDPPASASRGFFGSLFGGASVSLKARQDVRQVTLTDNFSLNGSMAILDMKSGDLNDLEPAIRANLDKYLVIIDIGEFFKKIQVAAVSNVNWDERLPDGSLLSDPIKAVQLEAAYPDFSGSLGAGGQPSMLNRTMGLHYIVGKKDQNRPAELARWTKDNPDDVVNIGFMRLAQRVGNWNPEDMLLRKTIVFDPEDPRVDLANGQDIVVKEERTTKLAPVISPADVGYVFIRFMISQLIESKLIKVTIKCTIGNRTDTLTIGKNSNNMAVWQLFSDKYFAATSFNYTVSVVVAGPRFTDPPVRWASLEPVVCPIPPGRIKYIPDLTIDLPPLPDNKVAIVNNYLAQATG